MSYATTFLRRGSFRDPECSHSSHRLSIAYSILSNQGVTWTTVHGNGVINQGVYGRHACADTCKTKIDQPWVTDEVLNATYQLADLIQTARGGWNRQQAFEAKERADGNG